MHTIAPLILCRKPRGGPGWHEGLSHIGGLPALNGQDWPRDAKGVPMYFVAQVDMAEVAALRGDQRLPQDGLLLFFLSVNDLWTPAVLHVPTNATRATPPEDAPPLFGADWHHIFPFIASEDSAPRSLPRWPVSFHPAPLEQEGEVLGAAAEAVADAVATRPAGVLTPRDARIAALLPEVEGLPHMGVHWYHSILLWADSLVHDLNAIPASAEKLDADIAKLEQRRSDLIWDMSWKSRFLGKRTREKRSALKRCLDSADRWRDIYASEQHDILARTSEFRAFVAAALDWVEGKDPWQVITAEDRVAFWDMVNRRDADFGALPWRTYQRASIADLGRDTLRIMATGPDDLWQRLPRELRDHINTHHLFPSESAGWHQMFGRGREIQGEVFGASEILLLQLTYDDLMFLTDSDLGAWKFSIGAEALANRQWHKARVIRESH